MIAIILAAGMGRRLKSLTLDQTKCMVKIAGERLIDRMIHNLLAVNLDKIVIVTGHKSDNLEHHLKNKYPNEGLEFIYNNLYQTTNNIYSLSLATKYLEENDSLVLESDLIFDSGILEGLIADPNPNLSIVAEFQPWMNGTMLVLDNERNVTRFIHYKDLETNNDHKYYKTVNIHKFSKEFSKSRYIPFLKTYISVFGKNEFYEQVLSVLSILDKTGLKGYILKNENWYEIDDQQDLITAEILFSKEDSLSKYKELYGGYWRFPKILDYNYLVNPYFPTISFKQEFSRLFDKLLCSYPSGRKTNDLLASNLFGINKDYICVANGASELIKELGTIFAGHLIGVIYPTFEEYPNSFSKNQVVPFFLSEIDDFEFDAVNLMKYYNEHNISALILINPNIPTGTLIKPNDISLILKWAQEKNIAVIIDESFMDFSDEPKSNSFFNNENLMTYTNLIIIKSISKSYGVPGIRLGVLGSKNVKLNEQIRQNLPIWNINSFAEHFMQIAPRYENEYYKACTKLRKERSLMFNKLSKLSFLKTFPSQGNFFLCKIEYGFTSLELAEILIKKNNILIKDCSYKLGLDDSQFIRLAIRNENEILLNTLSEIQKEMIEQY